MNNNNDYPWWGWFVDITEEVKYDKQKISHNMYQLKLPTIYSIKSFKSVTSLTDYDYKINESSLWSETNKVITESKVNKSKQYMNICILFFIFTLFIVYCL